jgi:hypothetical protein
MWGGALLALTLGGCAHEQVSTTQESAMPVAENQPTTQAIERQPVAGKEQQNLVLRPQGKYELKQGEYSTSQGEYFHPQGIYGTKGKITAQGNVMSQGTFGTYSQPTGTRQQPTGLQVSPEGTFYRPFGGQMTERQPVAGHEEAYLFVRGSSGKTWQLTSPTVINRVKQKLTDQGCNVGAVDGKADEQFAKGLMQCQQKNGLPPTGVIDQATAQKLGIDFESLRAKPHEQHEQQPQQ